MKVAVVTNGASNYDDAVWDWLGAHRSWFDDDEHDLVEAFDYWRAWGLFILVGCKIKGSWGGDWQGGGGITITFNGDARELLRRLNTLLPDRLEAEA